MFSSSSSADLCGCAGSVLLEKEYIYSHLPVSQLAGTCGRQQSDGLPDSLSYENLSGSADIRNSAAAQHLLFTSATAVGMENGMSPVSTGKAG